MNKLLNISVSDFDFSIDHGHTIYTIHSNCVEHILHSITVFRTIKVNDHDLVEVFQTSEFYLNDLELTQNCHTGSCAILEFLTECDDDAFNDNNRDAIDNLEHINACVNEYTTEEINVLDTLEKCRELQEFYRDLTIKTKEMHLTAFDFIDDDHTSEPDDYIEIETDDGETVLILEQPYEKLRKLLMNKLLNITVSDFKLCADSDHKISLDIDENIEFIYHDIKVYRVITIADQQLIEIYKSKNYKGWSETFNNLELLNEFGAGSSEILGHMNGCNTNRFWNDDLEYVTKLVPAIDTQEKSDFFEQFYGNLTEKVKLSAFDFIDDGHSSDPADYEQIKTDNGKIELKLINKGQS